MKRQCIQSYSELELNRINTIDMLLLLRLIMRFIDAHTIQAVQGIDLLRYVEKKKNEMVV